MAVLYTKQGAVKLSKC